MCHMKWHRHVQPAVWSHFIAFLQNTQSVGICVCDQGNIEYWREGNNRNYLNLPVLCQLYITVHNVPDCTGLYEWRCINEWQVFAWPHSGKAVNWVRTFECTWRVIVNVAIRWRGVCRGLGTHFAWWHFFLEEHCLKCSSHVSQFISRDVDDILCLLSRR